MDWLMHNAVADMYGPYFLLLYAFVILSTCVACRLWLRRRDWTASLPVAAIPASPDPYEIAYLRGGEKELAQSVVFSLIQRGHLRVNESGKEPRIERTAATPAQRALPPLERSVYASLSTPRPARELFRSTMLSGPLKSFASTYEERLRKEHLLTPPDARRAAVLIWLMGACVITAFGGYKLWVALEKGRSNVLFLIIMCVAALLVLAATCATPRLSRKGRTYLERLQLAFERLKPRVKNPSATIPAANSATPAADAAATTASASVIDPTPLLLVGVFGADALAGTAYDYYPRSFRQAAHNGASGGSSSADSGGDSGGGSSCSGGSSCGGGGCGGCGS